jgi:predicted nuclease with TOPRIM domain
MPDAPKPPRTSEVFREPLGTLYQKIDGTASPRHLAKSLSTSDVDGALKALTELKAIKEVEDSFEKIQQKHKDGDDISKKISDKNEEITNKSQEINKLNEELRVLRNSKATLEKDQKTQKREQTAAAQKYADALPKLEGSGERFVRALEAHYVNMIPSGFGTTVITQEAVDQDPYASLYASPISTTVLLQQLVLEKVGKIILIHSREY